MRTFVLAAAAAMAATTASAVDLPIPGLALNTEVVAEHKIDAATTTVVANPELEWQPMIDGALTLTTGMELSLYDNVGGVTALDNFDEMPTIDFGASYMLLENLELEAGTSYNFETDSRSDITLSATFSF